MNVTRRQFLVSTAGAAAFTSVAFTGCAPAERKFLLESPVKIPEDTLSGFENWYATVCNQCDAGCGLVVRVMDGRALKIEGNPDYPTNLGKTCVRGLSGLQSTYHPDRIDGPRKRTGDRGSGQFQAVAWDDALNELWQQLKKVSAQSQLLMVTSPIGGHLSMVVDRFVKALGGKHVVYAPVETTVEREAIRRVFGQDQLPTFDLANSNYILSFGSDFLGTWLSPVQYGRGYGAFRQGQPGVGGRKRGTFVQFDSRLSVTATNADQWFPVNPGTEGLVALAIATELIAGNLANADAVKALTGGAGASALSQYSADAVAKTTGVSADVIRGVAKAFGSAKPAVAFGGGFTAAQTNGLFNLQAIYMLNLLVGNVGVPGGVLFNPPSPFTGVPVSVPPTPFNQWQQILQQTGSLSALLIHDANPVYGLPSALNAREALLKAPLIVSFSSYMDETTAIADLILPDNSPLENWGNDMPEPGPGYSVVGFQQPAINPRLNSRPFSDVLLRLANLLGGAAQSALPWVTMEDVLKDAAKTLQGLKSGSVPGNTTEEFWINLMQRGGWWDTKATSKASAPSQGVTFPKVAEAKFAGDAATYPYHLIVYPSATVGAGESANLPFAQQTPDPMTTIAWQTWVEVNPNLAKTLGVEEGDVISVEGPNGAIEVPAYIYPGIGPESVAIPMGRGHHGYTRYADNYGANPLSMLAPLADTDTGALAWGATRVRLRKTGRKMTVAKFEGTVKPLLNDVRELYQITNKSS